MRMDTILMTLGVAVVAAATYFVLETTLPPVKTELASVVPEEPQVVEQSRAAERVENR